MTRLWKGLLRFAVVGLGLLLGAGIAGAETTTPVATPAPLRLSAFAVNLYGLGRTNTAPIEIVIDHWSNQKEHDALLAVLKNKGEDKLLDALQAMKPRAGYIRTTTSLGWDIQYAREYPLKDGGLKIVFATDRPMGFFELRNQTRSTQYEFMLCEIHLDKDGHGVGKLATAAKISYNKAKDQVEVENFSFEPVRLNNVAVEK
jgi:hypothetical protein